MHINMNVLKSLKNMAFIYLCMCGDVHVCPYIDVRRRPVGTDSLFPPVASKNEMGYEMGHLLSSLSGPL